MNLRTLATGAVVGILVYGGAYFFMPPPQAVQAGSCYAHNVEDDVKKAIRYCMDGATISNGTISTYC